MANPNQKFLWGVATSAFQIEGHLQNDMTEWERSGLFNFDGKHPVSGIAADHWSRWEEDFKLLKNLNVNAYRFSMDWGRIEPRPNRFDEQALSQYDRMVDRLLELQIVPMLTLHHFTHPTWFQLPGREVGLFFPAPGSWGCHGFTWDCTTRPTYWLA